MKGVQIVNGLPVKHALAKQVLISVGDGLAVWVGSAGIREDARVPGRGRTRKSDAHARLDNGVASRAVAPVWGQFDAV